MKFSAWRMSSCAQMSLVTCLVLLVTFSVHAQSLKAIYRFQGTPGDGFGPVGGVFVDSDGTLYGTTEFGGAHCGLCRTVFRIRGTAEAWTYAFRGSGSDGAVPLGKLVMGPGGTLYGTTSSGGSHACGLSRATCGVMFAITKDGKETVLYDFQGGTDAGQPGEGPLWIDPSGTLYGLTTRGGHPGCAGGCGTVFELSGTTEKVRYRFCSKADCADGKYPRGGLVRDAAGNFYGSADGGAHGKGIVFKLSPDGTLTVLHDFCAEKDCADGQLPSGDLFLDATAGTLYGTTAGGGTGTACGKGCGTLFTLSTSGGGFTLLHSFADTPDGRYPQDVLSADGAGNLYGITSTGGPDHVGTVFEYSVKRGYRLLWSFSNVGLRSRDGWQPAGTLTLRGGELYGTTTLGGHSGCQGGAGCGTVFELTP